MDSNRATVFANHTAEGVSVIGVDIYVASRRLHILASKKFIDDLNGIPFLDLETIKNEVAKKFQILKADISFQ